MKKMKKLISLWVPFVIYTILLCYLSSISKIGSPGGKDISYLHFPAYFALAFLLLRISFNSVRGKYPFLIAFIFSFLIGLFIELYQLVIPARSFSFMDIVLNSTGAVLIYIFKIKKLQALLLLR